VQLPGWLKKWGGGTFIFGVVGVLGLALVGYTIWDRTSSQGPPAASAAPPAGQANSTTSGPSVSPWSATSLDAKRKGAEPSGAELAAARARDEAALERNPNDAEALNNLGLSLERSGQIDDAIARFSRAAQIGTRNWAYHFNLAHALAQRQNWDRAISEYRIAASLYPTDAATHCNLATALQKKGDDAAAIPVFERAVQLAPSEPACHLAFAASLEKEGRDADARREYQQYLELAPAAPDAETVKSHLQSLGSGRS
jgi:Flp pilus assembly protein TadD